MLAVSEVRVGGCSHSRATRAVGSCNIEVHVPCIFCRTSKHVEPIFIIWEVVEASSDPARRLYLVLSFMRDDTALCVMLVINSDAHGETRVIVAESVGLVLLGLLNPLPK